MNLDFIADILGALRAGLAFSTYDTVVLSLSALGIVFVALFVLPIGLQRLASYREANQRLNRLRRHKADEQRVSMSAVMGCFSGATHMTNDASSYLRTVQRLSDRREESTHDFGTSEPAERYFHTDKLGRSVVRDMAYALGLLLTGLAVISLVLSALASVGLGAASGETAAVGTNPYTIAVPAVAALLLFLSAELMYLAQRREIRRLCWLLDELFLVPSSLLVAEPLVTTLRMAANRQREILTGLASEIREAVEGSQRALIQAIRAHDESVIAGLSERLGDALQGPAQVLGEASRQIAEDQSARVKGLVEEVLGAFVAELTVVERGQLESLRDVLAATFEATRRLQDAFDAAAGRLAEDAGAQAAALTERLHGLIAEDLGGSVASVRAAAASLEEAASELRAVIEQLQTGLQERAISGPGRPARAAGASEADRVTSNEIADILGEFQEETDKLSRALGRR